MCLCPISIPDKLLATFGVKRSDLLVPCGHCVECARDRRNDWFVRLYSLYQRYASARIPVWFVTVTIDPSLHPDLFRSSPGVENRVTPFIRSWNERFRYLNGGKMPLRFLCSEYGSEGEQYIDDHGRVRITTGALHFHGLIFGYLDIPHLQSGLSKTHGYVKFDRIRGPEGIRYIVKYCTKDYSITNPLLRARTFCSPGLGDPSFFFGDSMPTRIVLINGYHYRTPRYFYDLQVVRVYSKHHFVDPFSRVNLRRSRESLTDPFGRFITVRENVKRRYEVYKNLFQVPFVKPRLDNSITLESLRALVSLGRVGSGHPLLRRLERSRLDAVYRKHLEQDCSFINYKPPLNFNFNTEFYERYQAFLSFSCNIPS